MTVYAVQKQMRYNPETGQSEPRFATMNKAEKWGEIVYCLTPQHHPFETEAALGSLHECLSGFNSDDYLILVGNPVLLGMATAIAAYYNEGKVNFLQWSAKQNEYLPIKSAIF